MISSRWLSSICACSLLCSSLSFAKESEKDTCCCSPALISKAFTNVAKRAIPAVVFIKTQISMGDEEEQNPYQNPFDQFGEDFFQRFFGAPRSPNPRPPQISQGSGFFVSADGYIMTNAHVVKSADRITVVLDDERELDATLVGSDPHTDIAIIKVEGKDLPFLDLGNSDAMEIGEWVVAIGSPFQLEASLTVGVVSAKGRQNLRITDLEDFIQTDAAINPGNSGGPLLNLNSEVIGINTAIVSRSGGYMGIGFAIPSNMARNIMNQIINNGGVVTRGFLGVSMQPVDKDIAEAFNLDKPEGALVSEVVKDSPADKAGLKQGDIILEYNKIPVKSLGSFRNDISMMAPGTVLQLKVNRKGKILTVPVTLGSASDTLSSAIGIAQKLGVEVEDITPDHRKQLNLASTDEGVVITKVKPGSPAAMAGLRPGFVILALNHKKIANVSEFNEAISDKGNQNRVLILVKHGSMTRFYSIRLS